ncbi:MAG: flavin reductase [Methanothrix sp.]|jgi:flavin reductase (DIM6/NTAB) family NADH-FMN oxidoreductase RutF|nr:flavin reductase [Methanothrix sp.]
MRGFPLAADHIQCCLRRAVVALPVLKTDKSHVFDVFYGSLRTAPMIRECPVSLECRLVQTVSLPTNTLFIGEIAGAYADGRVMKDGKPDYAKIDPLLLTMPENRYWKLGECVGDVWSAGRNLIQSKEAIRKDDA